MAESGGNRLKLRNRLKLFSKKSFKIESFEFPSLELKNIFSGVYPHQTHAPYTPCIPPNFKGHIGPSFPQGERKTLNLEIEAILILQASQQMYVFSYNFNFVQEMLPRHWRPKYA